MAWFGAGAREGCFRGEEGCLRRRARTALWPGWLAPCRLSWTGLWEESDAQDASEGAAEGAAEDALQDGT